MQKTNILLVEDDRMIIENLTEFLKTEGFQVWSADGQEKAMKILRNQHFDLILLDITLAQGNGYSTCTQIKSHYEIPIIFLTALLHHAQRSGAGRRQGDGVEYGGGRLY